MKSKLSVVSMSLVAVAVCLCFAQGLSAQSAKPTPPASGINSFSGVTGAPGASSGDPASTLIITAALAILLTS